MSRFVRTEEGRVFKVGTSIDEPVALELIDGEFVDTDAPVSLGLLMDARPISESEVTNFVNRKSEKG